MKAKKAFFKGFQAGMSEAETRKWGYGSRLSAKDYWRIRQEVRAEAKAEREVLRCVFTKGDWE